MAGFKKSEREMPEMNTSSLPDLIFTILFFFMCVVTMREVTLQVKFVTPQGTELEKLTKKSVVSYIYVGPPTDQLRPTLGNGTRVQINDRIIDGMQGKDANGNERNPYMEIMDFVKSERQGMSNQAEQIISIKADEKTPMRHITLIKEVLRKSWALRINYSATHRK